MKFSRKAFIGRVAAISWSVAVANFSLEQRVFCLGCAEISLILSFILSFTWRGRFQGAAANFSPEHRVFRAEISF